MKNKMSKQEYIEKTGILKVIFNTLKKIIYDIGSRTRTAPLVGSVAMLAVFVWKLEIFVENSGIAITWLLIAFLFMGTGIGSGVLQKYLDAIDKLKK